MHKGDWCYIAVNKNTKTKTKKKQLNSPLIMHYWLNNLWQIQMIQNYSSMKRNESIICTETEGCSR